MNTENSKMNEPHNFDLNLSQILHLRSSNKGRSSKFVYLLYVEKYKTV